MRDVGPGTALVIGATGGFGNAVARALLAHGWKVRALARDPVRARAAAGLPADVDWRAGDAMSMADICAAAARVRLIVHGASPPGYRDWENLAIPMLANAIAGARASGARLVFPGNIYNFGPDAWPVLVEDSPQNPVSRKGAIRVRMEAMLRAAAADGVRSLIVRAGDFFGPHAPSTWMQSVMVKPGRTVRTVTDPGIGGAGHAWAYLPDLGEAVARLVALEHRLAPVEAVNFAGHWMADGRAMARGLARAAGLPETRVRAFPWPIVRLVAPFVPFLREVVEMRYLWAKPIRLDNSRLERLIGAEPHTDLDTALRRCLTAWDCVAPTAAPAPAVLAAK